MTQGVYLAAVDAGSGKVAVALGMTDLLARRVGTVGVFRPVIQPRPGHDRDPLTETLRSRYTPSRPYEECVGVTEEQVLADPDAAISEIVGRYHALAAGHAAVVVLGTDFSGAGMPSEFAFNARVAANLATPVLLVMNGEGRGPDDVASAAHAARKDLDHEHATEFGVVVNRVAPGRTGEVEAALRAHGLDDAYVIPRTPRLTAPTVHDLMTAVRGRLLFGDPARLGREVPALTLAATTLPTLLESLHPDGTVIVAGDRAGVLVPGLLMAHRAEGFPELSAILVTEAEQIPGPILRLLEGCDVAPPVLGTDLDPLTTGAILPKVRGTITPGATGKIKVALDTFAAAVDGDELLRRFQLTESRAVTPLIFEHTLLRRARAERRHIVLPEGEEERILRAADLLLHRDVVDLTLLGDPLVIAQKARDLNLDVSAAQIIDPATSPLREQLAAEYAGRRAHKGVTMAFARDIVEDVSYFGTLLVAAGLADGMVSGAVHTTAHTVRPAFELLRDGLVSSVFFMGLADRVLVYGDCAVNPDPTAEQLADIAVASARTAAQFDVEPRVAMLSYSTGTSGQGVDVDKVRAATELVRRNAPELPVEGPIQYDAAADPTVAAAKMPESPVAGRATVFIVPDLNTGNNLYKAVQRSAGAIAVGPVLQGLKRPVNDLSRGATVHDIVNTVAITAIQAQ